MLWSEGLQETWGQRQEAPRSVSGGPEAGGYSEGDIPPTERAQKHPLNQSCGKGSQ